VTKIAGSGSISQGHGSADPDPDPHKNVMEWICNTVATVCVTLCFDLVGDLKRLNLSEGEYESLEAMESAKAQTTISTM
jgi:hypothetical protein